MVETSRRNKRGNKHFSRWYTALATCGMMAAASLLLDDTTTSDPKVRREMVMRSRGVSTHENTPLSFAESTVCDAGKMGMEEKRTR